LIGPDRPRTQTQTKKQKEEERKQFKKATAVQWFVEMEDFSSPGFFDSYYGAETDVEKGESFQDILHHVDWLLEDAPSYPLPVPVPVGLPGEPKEEKGKNKEVAFPGFPALKHQQQKQQQQTVSEDDSANTGDLNTNQQLKLAQTQASQLQSKKRNALPEEAVAWGSSDLDSCCEDSSKSGATAKRAKREGGTDSDTNTNACQSKKKEEDSVDRKEKNRRSAALSRERKKAAMDSMLLRCKALESTNATLNYLLSMANVEIQALRRELASSNTSARSVGNNNKGFTKKSTETEQTGPTYLPAVQPIDNIYNLDFLKLESPRSLCRPPMKMPMDKTRTSSLDCSRACRKNPMERLRSLLFTLVVATHNIHVHHPVKGLDQNQGLETSSVVARDTIRLLQNSTSRVLSRWFTQKKMKKKRRRAAGATWVEMFFNEASTPPLVRAAR
jgi:hypothetical protein